MDFINWQTTQHSSTSTDKTKSIEYPHQLSAKQISKKKQASLKARERKKKRKNNCNFGFTANTNSSYTSLEDVKEFECKETSKGLMLVDVSHPNHHKYKHQLLFRNIKDTNTNSIITTSNLPSQVHVNMSAVDPNSCLFFKLNRIQYQNSNSQISNAFGKHTFTVFVSFRSSG